MIQEIREKKWYGLFLGNKLISTRVEGHCDIRGWIKSIDIQLGRNPIHLDLVFEKMEYYLECLERKEKTIDEVRKKMVSFKETFEEYLLEEKTLINYDVYSIWEMDVNKGRTDENKILRVY